MGNLLGTNKGMRMGTATVLPLHRHTALAMSVLVLNRSLSLYTLLMSAGPSHSFFGMWQRLFTLIRGIFQPTLLIRGGNSPPLSHWIDLPMRTGFVVLALIFRHLESFGYPIATSYLGKTCDLIARTCSPETQTAASIATVINQQANYRSITLSQRAREDRRRGTILCVHA